MPSYSGVWTMPAVYQAVAQGNWPIPPLTGDIGLFGGGQNISSQLVNVIDYIKITSTGNAVDFGDLTQVIFAGAACASSTRALFLAGYTTGFAKTNVISYITIATIGNATDFGDISVETGELAGLSSSTRGVVGGGNVTGANNKTNVIEYVTIASTGNATDFGDLTQARSYFGACASSTRGVFLGGSVPSPDNYSNVMDYITIASTGNATDFGDVNRPASGVTSGGAACSNSTRGLLGGGSASGLSRTNIISYITIASVGDTSDFGDLTIDLENLGAGASSSRGVWAGGDSGGESNVIGYVTIASLGNATDFGDLTLRRDGDVGCSNCHGGL